MKYRIEHIRYIPGQGKSYNETIDNTGSDAYTGRLK